MGTEPLPKLVEELPVSERKTVREFVEFLLTKKRRSGTRRKLRQDWAGILRDYGDRFTSLELQQKALEWRSEF